MKINTAAICATALLTVAMSVAPANAAGLLGGLIGGDGGSSSNTAGSVADVKSGPAGNDALANVGLGSGGGNNGNIADVNVGGRDGLLRGLTGNRNGTTANVNVSSGGGRGGLLGGSNLTADIDLGGLSLDLNAPGLGGLIGGGDGGNGGPGGPGGPGGNGGIGGGGTLVSSIGGGSMGVNCSVNDGRQVLQLASQAKVNVRSWSRAANVQVVPVRLCAQARSQVAQIFNASGKIQQLQSAAAGDALISASLSRTSYDTNDVFAVQANGGRLMVYVY